MKILQSHPYPDAGRWEVPDMKKYQQRWDWTDSKGMFAFVCWDWVNPLADWLGQRKVLEIMAGAGWLAKALRMKGVDIIATDDFSWIDNREWLLQTDIERLAAVKAVRKYGHSVDVMICSWPYMDDDAYQSFRLLHKLNPSAILVYIGEWAGGCTASDRFFEHFEVIENYQFALVRCGYQRWWGLHDNIYLGRYV